jgi:hypothetical protein
MVAVVRIAAVVVMKIVTAAATTIIATKEILIVPAVVFLHLHLHLLSKCILLNWHSDVKIRGLVLSFSGHL